MRHLLTIAVLLAAALTSTFGAAQERALTIQQQTYVQPAGPRLGIQAVPSGNSLEVVSIVYGTPASRLGLEAGDRILEVNGRKIRSVYDLQNALQDAATYRSGMIRVLVDNVRARAGIPGAQRFVNQATFLDGYAPLSGGYDPNVIPVYTSDRP